MKTTAILVLSVVGLGALLYQRQPALRRADYAANIAFAEKARHLEIEGKSRHSYANISVNPIASATAATTLQASLIAFLYIHPVRFFAFGIASARFG